MSDCCSAKNINSKEPAQTLTCPHCREKGKPVEILTLKSLLISDAMRRLDSSPHYQFCRTSDCPIVYFHGTASFSKGDLAVKVFQKEISDSAPVCYCFGFDRKSLRDDISHNGKSTIQEQVKQYVKDKKCACEIRNPQGSCCLGNIAQVIKTVQNNKAGDKR